MIKISDTTMDYNIDAKNKRLGRLASDIAVILQGKKNPDYTPHCVSKDRVILSNWDKITIGGKKMTDKIYYRHTGYMGHLKSLTFGQAYKKDPKKVVRETVRHMLPKNFISQRRLNNLVFVEQDKSDKN